MIRIDNTFKDKPVDVQGNAVVEVKNEKTTTNPKGRGRIGKKDPNFISKAKGYHYISASEAEWIAIRQYADDVKSGKIDITHAVEEIKKREEAEAQARIDAIEAEDNADKPKRGKGRPFNDERGVESQVRKQHQIRAFEHEWLQIKEFIALQRESFEATEIIIDFTRKVLASKINLK